MKWLIFLFIAPFFAQKRYYAKAEKMSEKYLCFDYTFVIIL
jgi:hypothetical protein